MDVHVLAWSWLARAAVGGLIVLALGSLAAYRFATSPCGGLALSS